MPTSDYYRKQAQLFASLALAIRDPSVIARYNTMALEHLAKAEELEPSSAQVRPVTLGDGGSDLDRD